MRGKATRIKPDRVYEETINIPLNFYHLHHYVTLVADVNFVNSEAFLVTMSQKIGFRTVEYLPNRQATTLSSCLIKVIKLYARAEFVVNLILMDQEFDKLEGVIENVDRNIGSLAINTIASREHVREIERIIFPIKNVQEPLAHSSHSRFTQAGRDSSSVLCDYFPKLRDMPEWDIDNSVAQKNRA